MQIPNHHLCSFLICKNVVNAFPVSNTMSPTSSSIGTTAHCGLWPVEQCSSIFSYLPPHFSIFSLPALEDLFLLPLSNFSWVFPFFSSPLVFEWRYFWASYPPSFSPGDLTSLSFALLSILLYFLLCSSLLVKNNEPVHKHYVESNTRDWHLNSLLSIVVVSLCYKWIILS